MNMKKRKSWTKESLKEEALKYKSRRAFVLGNNSAYVLAKRYGIFEEICSHMPAHVDQSGENHVGYKWSPENIKKEALKYKTRLEFFKNAGSAYNAAKKYNILDDVCLHMPKRKKNFGPDNAAFKWSKEELHKEALKYNTRIDFVKNSPSAYSIAHKSKILDLICSHMVDKLVYWTEEKVIKEAKKYKTKSELLAKGKGAYVAGRRMGIIDKMHSHMPKSNNTSHSEIDLFDTIKEKFPKTQKFRDRKGNVPNKPHIKGFDIDIYIPELRKGIEFDGEYWHSFETMRKAENKSLWPDEDLKNYHQIKDQYFRSKGIELLHIKEQDWLDNKEACIKKCFEFLGV